ncbi:hypothetical protein BpHYR1_010628 [Brachionus plicatilis]|uniref:Uncharacterized protein n=1 Tax=Brachionus plicatilis TaxID=10195 RepID=A0A3M7S708_BRAPC|nr:hypothetical protein BpHYR1_010628 [Brachionus plicatilis]
MLKFKIFSNKKLGLNFKKILETVQKDEFDFKFFYLLIHEQPKLENLCSGLEWKIRERRALIIIKIRHFPVRRFHPQCANAMVMNLKEKVGKFSLF